MSMAMTQEPLKIGGTQNRYFWPMFQADVSGNILTKYGRKYGTNVPTHFRILKLPLIDSIQYISSACCSDTTNDPSSLTLISIGYFCDLTRDEIHSNSYSTFMGFSYNLWIIYGYDPGQISDNPIPGRPWPQELAKPHKRPPQPSAQRQMSGATAWPRDVTTWCQAVDGQILVDSSN